MGQFTGNAVTHGGGGGWGYSGGDKPSLITPANPSSKVHYQFNDLLDALIKLSGNVPPSYLDLKDPKSPLTVATINFCADPERAACDVAGLLNRGQHIKMSAFSLVLVHCHAQGLPSNALGLRSADLRSALLSCLIRDLQRVALGSRLGDHAEPRVNLLRFIMGQLRLLWLRTRGVSGTFWTDMEAIGWGLQAVALLSPGEDDKPVLMATLHETTALTDLIRKVAHSKSASEGVGPTPLTAEFRVCEALATGLDLLDEEERHAFCCTYLFGSEARL